MKALEFIKLHPEIRFWNIFRWIEDDTGENEGWKIIDVDDIEDYELVDDSFILDDSCDVYLINY